MPEPDIKDILNQLNNNYTEGDLEEFFNNLSVREREIIEKPGPIDPELLKSNTKFIVPDLTAIIPFGYGFDALVETSRTYNVYDGTGEYSINISGDGISFVTPQGI